jgi:hypothetical protein
MKPSSCDVGDIEIVVDRSAQLAGGQNEEIVEIWDSELFSLGSNDSYGGHDFVRCIEHL